MKTKTERCIREIRGITAFEIFERLREKGDFLLESSLKNQLGKFTIAGFKPYLSIEECGRGFTVNGKAFQGDILSYIKKYLKENGITEKDLEMMGISGEDIPFVDGCIGYFTYGFGMGQMGIKSKHREKIKMPKAMFKFYDFVVVENHEENRIFLICNGKTNDSRELMEEVSRKIEALKHDIDRGEERNRKEVNYFQKEGKHLRNGEELCFGNKNSWKCDFSKEEYKRAVSHMIERICAGDIYVVNMTQQLNISGEKKPFQVYTSLRERNPAPFSAFLEEDEYSILCASPERFLKCESGRVWTRPIKGTRRRGVTEQEDLQFREELANSEKDRCELRMIVDLERNDFNKVCAPGSVKVPRMFDIEEYATVFHLSSTVEGTLGDSDVTDLISASFPGGSITGAPKRRSMELIDDIEKSSRGLYTGCIGYIGLDGNCDFNIVIRTAVYQDGIYQMGAGGGITWESELEFEYEEVFQKALALEKAIVE
ncbi:MAG: aminodeoxychorismate synthase component I [Hornefia sp.]|nr:aminodeoxychorismate synthase component I [Hornefia sp.]